MTFADKVRDIVSFFVKRIVSVGDALRTMCSTVFNAIAKLWRTEERRGEAPGADSGLQDVAPGQGEPNLAQNNDSPPPEDIAIAVTAAVIAKNQPGSTPRTSLGELRAATTPARPVVVVKPMAAAPVVLAQQADSASAVSRDKPTPEPAVKPGSTSPAAPQAAATPVVPTVAKPVPAVVSLDNRTTEQPGKQAPAAKPVSSGQAASRQQELPAKAPTATPGRHPTESSGGRAPVVAGPGPADRQSRQDYLKMMRKMRLAFVASVFEEHVDIREKAVRTMGGDLSQADTLDLARAFLAHQDPGFNPLEIGALQPLVEVSQSDKNGYSVSASMPKQALMALEHFCNAKETTPYCVLVTTQNHHLLLVAYLDKDTKKITVMLCHSTGTPHYGNSKEWVGAFHKALTEHCAAYGFSVEAKVHRGSNAVGRNGSSCGMNAAQCNAELWRYWRAGGKAEGFLFKTIYEPKAGAAALAHLAEMRKNRALQAVHGGNCVNLITSMRYIETTIASIKAEDLAKITRVHDAWRAVEEACQRLHNSTTSDASTITFQGRSSKVHEELKELERILKAADPRSHVHAEFKDRRQALISQDRLYKTIAGLRELYKNWESVYGSAATASVQQSSKYWCDSRDMNSDDVVIRKVEEILDKLTHNDYDKRVEALQDLKKLCKKKPPHIKRDNAAFLELVTLAKEWQEPRAHTPALQKLWDSWCRAYDVSRNKELDDAVQSLHQALCDAEMAQDSKELVTPLLLYNEWRNAKDVSALDSIYDEFNTCVSSRVGSQHNMLHTNLRTILRAHKGPNLVYCPAWHEAIGEPKLDMDQFWFIETVDEHGNTIRPALTERPGAKMQSATAEPVAQAEAAMAPLQH